VVSLDVTKCRMRRPLTVLLLVDDLLHAGNRLSDQSSMGRHLGGQLGKNSHKEP